jgi:putative membrane protein
MTKSGFLSALALISLAGVACDTIDRSDQPKGEVPVDTNPVVAAATDPEIAFLLQTAGAVIQRRATLAKGRAKSTAVRAFADDVVLAHSQFNAQTVRLLLASNLVPVNSEQGKRLMADGNTVFSELNQKDGALFDVAYIDHEIAFHQKLLALLDSALLPVVRNPDLRAELERARPMLAAHLENASALQRSVH